MSEPQPIAPVESETRFERILQGGLYTLLGVIPPVVQMLSSDAKLTGRSLTCLVFTAIGGGGLALKAYLSTAKRKPPGAEAPAPPAPVAPATPWLT